MQLWGREGGLFQGTAPHHAHPQPSTARPALVVRSDTSEMATSILPSSAQERSHTSWMDGRVRRWLKRSSTGAARGDPVFGRDCAGPGIIYLRAPLQVASPEPSTDPPRGPQYVFRRAGAE